MNHVAHVRLVDAHAEGDRGDDDLRTIFDERVLIGLAHFVGQAGVIGQGLVARRLQVGAQLFDVGAANAIDEARVVRVAVDHFATCRLRSLRGCTRYTRFGRSNEPIRISRFPQMQLAHDVVAHATVAVAV